MSTQEEEKDVKQSEDLAKAENAESASGESSDGPRAEANDGKETNDLLGDNGVASNENNNEDDIEDEEDEDDDDSSEEAIVSSEPLATTRSRRANAGNRMSTLLLEEEDEFYSSKYGGFKEEEDDDDFDEEEEADEVEVEEDYDVDSDFDIDETDEIAPEHQAEDEERRPRKSAYREPKRKIHQPSAATGSIKTSTPTASKASGVSLATPQSPNKHRPERSFRDSTKKKTAETIKNIESVKKRRRFRNVEPHRRLSQEELLEEAKITEAENLKSLEIYRRLEAENLKKIKLIKKSIPIPYMTYYSSVFTNPESRERYSRNLCTYVGCEPGSQSDTIATT